MTHRILVIGAGSGGIIAANLLAKNLRPEIRDGKIDVTVLDRSGTHRFQPDYLNVAFHALNPKSISKPVSKLLREEVNFRQEAVSVIDPKQKLVKTSAGEEICYDHAIIATGASVQPELIPGLKEGSLNFHQGPESAHQIYEALGRFQDGHLVIGIASVPYKCPPSPNEAAFMAEEYFRKRRIRDKVRITFVTPYPRAYPAEPLSKIIEPLFDERGIAVQTFFNVDSVDPSKRIVYSLDGDEMSYDMLIMVPPHRGNRLVVDSGLGDEEGWIPTDKYTMRTKEFNDMFAIGDATNIPISKSGVVAHLEAEVAVRNIITDIQGNSEVYKYNGRINCPFETANGKATFVVSTYSTPVKPIKPTRSRYLAKKSFSRIYWSALKGNLDWMFKLYFGKIYDIEASRLENATQG